MKQIIVLILVVIAVFSSGCDESPEKQNYNVRSAQTRRLLNVSESSRVSVVRIGVFRDETTYNGERGVYLIKDTKNNTEFIGISGIGISETHGVSRQCGKVHYTEYVEE